MASSSNNAIEQAALVDLMNTLEGFHLGTPESKVHQALQRYLDVSKGFQKPASFLIADADHDDHVRRAKSALEELGARYEKFRQTWDNSWGNPTCMPSASYERLQERCSYVIAVSLLCEMGVILRKALEAIGEAKIWSEYQTKVKDQLKVLQSCVLPKSFCKTVKQLLKNESQPYSVSTDQLALFPKIPHRLPLDDDEMLKIVMATQHSTLRRSLTRDRFGRYQENLKKCELVVASKISNDRRAREYIDDALEEISSRLRLFDQVQAAIEPLLSAKSGGMRGSILIIFQAAPLLLEYIIKFDFHAVVLEPALTKMTGASRP